MYVFILSIILVFDFLDNTTGKKFNKDTKMCAIQQKIHHLFQLFAKYDNLDLEGVEIGSEES